MFIFYFQEIIYQGLKIPSLNICNKQLPNSQKKRGGGGEVWENSSKKNQPLPPKIQNKQRKKNKTPHSTCFNW